MTEQASVDQQEMKAVILNGLASRKLAVVNSTKMRLLATIGRLEGTKSEEVLVGLVDLSFPISQAFEEDVTPDLFEVTLSVENVSFMLADMTREFAATCGALGRLASKKAPIDPLRVQTMQEYLSQAREALDLAQSELDSLGE